MYQVKIVAGIQQATFINSVPGSTGRKAKCVLVRVDGFLKAAFCRCDKVKLGLQAYVY